MTECDTFHGGAKQVSQVVRCSCVTSPFPPLGGKGGVAVAHHISNVAQFVGEFE
jgi:hypothetical protein